jgi:hypothetical protein
MIDDAGTYIVELRTADGEALAINVPVGETRVLKHFQERMPYGLFVPDVECRSAYCARGPDQGAGRGRAPGKRAFNIRAASPSLALLLPILPISRRA